MREISSFQRSHCVEHCEVETEVEQVNRKHASYRISEVRNLHFIGIQEDVFCILSEFGYFYYLCISYL